MARSRPNKNSSSEHFIAHSPEFHDVIGGKPSFYVVMETNAHEGPVYVRDEQALYFTTVPANTNVPIADSREVQIKRIDLNTKHFPLAPDAAMVISDRSNMANGMTLDREDRLVICEQGTKATWARISRMDLTTRETVTVVDQWRGLRFNSPNDVVVKSDGTVGPMRPELGYMRNELVAGRWRV